MSTNKISKNLVNKIIDFFVTWKQLGLFSKLHWKIVIYWGLLLFAVVISPLYLIKHPREMDSFYNATSENYPVLIIVSLSFFIIAIANFIYAFDVYSQTFNADKNIKKIKSLYGFSLFCCVVSVVACGIGMYRLTVLNNVHDIVHETEIFTLCIFVLLLFIDWLMLVAKNNEINYYNENDHQSELKYSLKERRFISKQLWFIDIPVLLGVLFISKYVQNADDCRFYSTQVGRAENVPIFQFFKTYFAVGSIGMHIIFSQFIFLILNTQMFYREICEKAETKSNYE